MLSIVALGTISILNSVELASGTRLARSFCAFAAIFWGVRLSLQPFLAAKPFLTTWWLRAGYHCCRSGLPSLYWSSPGPRFAEIHHGDTE